ncbi:hypothetical protein FRB95_012951 [Tulasnella sp. JGI-2019a]|nr:hypothetical protein FRB95_012951 [Tulasnella sp. JGI-2019a]
MLTNIYSIGLVFVKYTAVLSQSLSRSLLPVRFLIADPMQVNSPFDILPNEIITYILSLAIRTSNVEQLLSGIDRKVVFPFTALAVCTYWRDTALSTLAMWTTAVIATESSWIPCLRAHMERRGNLPLHIDAYITRQIDSAFIQTMMRNLIAGLGRPMTVRVILPHEQALHQPYFSIRCLLWILNYHPPRVASIEIAWDDVWRRTTDNNLVNKILSGISFAHPPLRSITITGLYILTPQNPSADAIYHLPLLEELRLKECGGYTLQLIQSINAPSLRLLAIDCSETILVSRVLTLVAPTYLQSLVHLILINTPSLGDALCIIEASIGITHLVLDCSIHPTIQERLCARSYPICRELESLTLLSPVVDQKTLEHVAGIRLPALRHLGLRFSDHVLEARFNAAGHSEASQSAPAKSKTEVKFDEDAVWLKENLYVKLLSQREVHPDRIWRMSQLS